MKNIDAVLCHLNGLAQEPLNDSKCVRVVPSADVEAGDVIQQMVRINSDGVKWC